MRIDRLMLDSFGAFRGVTVDFGPGLNFFFGENEDGKSTLIDGLLLTMLGAPAHSDRRQRYAPLDRRTYNATIYLTTAGGRALRIERNLAPSGQDKIGIRVGETWVVAKKTEPGIRDLRLPSFDLARSTVVISGGEVVIAGKDAGTVSKAISARATLDEGAVSGQQALKRLRERRVLLENKERDALNKQMEELRREERELARASAMGRALAQAWKEAADRLAAARDLAAQYRPAVEAIDHLQQSRQALQEIVHRHQTVLADLQSIRAREEEIARLERETAPLQDYAAAFTDASLDRLNKLAGAVAVRRREYSRHEAETRRLQDELAVLREKLAVRRGAGFTLERQRELERLDGAVELAAKNLSEREAALAGEKPPGALAAAMTLAAACAVLGGVVLGFYDFWPGWLMSLAAAGVVVMLAIQRGRRAERRRAYTIYRDQASRAVELARAAYLTKSGGRSHEEWLREFAGTTALAEEIRAKEIELEAKAGASEAASTEEAELTAMLAAAGCGTPEEFAERAAFLSERQRWLAEARSVRDSLLRGKTRAAWEEEEIALAREESVAKAVLDQAEVRAAGLDPIAIARYREELAALDLTALERAVAEAKSACDQHAKSSLQRDPWEIETGLALTQAALAENAARAEAVRLALEVLEQAVAEVQGNLIPRIEERAGSIFSRLTGGRYEGLTITSGPEMLDISPRLGGAALPERILSSGTADQMYLALRLALAEALQGPEPLPLILDDPFLTFDRRRQGLALGLLLELARESQIILVTKDEILRDLAGEAGVEVRGLPGKSAE